MLRFLVLAIVLAAAITAPGVETQPLAVISATDGDTITVQGDLGGQPLPVRVRLLYLDTPEKRANSHGEAMPEGRSASEALRAVLSKGAQVVLWGPGDALEADSYGRVLAVVYRVTDGRRENVNAAMVRAGWSPYWRKYGDAPEPVHTEMVQAQETARTANAGAWATAVKYMTDKSNERTAPKAKRP